MIAQLILAAGQSRRMRGDDKLLMQVAGLPLLRRQCLMARATGQPVFVALPAADHPRAAVIADLDVQVICVPAAAQGMSASLRDAVAQLPACEGILLILADLVALTTADLQAVLAARHSAPAHLIWRGATQDGKPGHPVLFSAALRAGFAALQGDQGAAPLVQAHQGQTCLVPLPGQHARLDLDTPEDWARWRADPSNH